MRTNTLFLVTVIVVLLDMMLSSCLLYRVRASGKVAHALDIASVQYHKNCLRDFFVSLGPLVLAIELMIHSVHWNSGRDLLYYAHMSCVGVFVVTSIAMYFLWTGVNRPTIHVPLSKWCMGSFASIALTGLIMMYQVLM